MDKSRLDQFLVSEGKVKTRSQARMLIKKGSVLVNGKEQSKPGFMVGEADQIEITEEIFVGRGAFKLREAILKFGIDAKGKVAADIGASTGGFTEILLQQGVSKVFAIDVGHDQLVESIQTDSRVINMEGVNVKFPILLEEKVDLAVIDLSFISLTKVMENIVNILKDDGEIIALIKPQFEVGREGLGKGGVVKDASLRDQVLIDLHEFFIKCGLRVVATIDSPIEGKEGNKEFLSYLTLGSLKLPGQ